jgi:hypothetical protein
LTQTVPSALPAQCVLLTHSVQRIVVGLHALVVAVPAQSVSEVQLITHLAVLPATSQI